MGEAKSLYAGFPAILPRTRTGQQVVLFDRRQHLITASGETHLKCIFYVFSVLAQDPRAQTEGVLGLVFLVTPRMTKMPFHILQRACIIAQHAFPVKLHWHLLNWLPKTGLGTQDGDIKRNAIRELMRRSVGLFKEYLTGQHQIEIHIEREA